MLCYSIADLVYGNIYEHYAHNQYISQNLILCLKNETDDLMNNYVIHLLPNEDTNLLGRFVEVIAAVNFPTEFLNSILPNCMPLH